jgi:GNAT superfamily N-acetyltransferase
MIDYQINQPLDPLEVIRVFDSSGIKRPTHDVPRIARMFAASNLVISAWCEGFLVGVARALTDHGYGCYLSDLAVDKRFQKQGIGKELIQQVRSFIGDEASLVLQAAPGAMSYYPWLGFEKIDNGFILRRVR